jgi:hypothetical protein
MIIMLMVTPIEQQLLSTTVQGHLTEYVEVSISQAFITRFVLLLLFTSPSASATIR